MTATCDTPHPAASEAVTDAGPGAPWLTLVHAFAQDRRVFSAQVAAFRARYRLLLVDLPGHGRSAALPGPYGLAEYAASVTAALDAAGIARTHWWGTHTGAGVGLLLACRAPERFASLVLEGAVLPGRLPPSAAGMLAECAALAREQGVEAARRHWWAQSAWFDVMRAHPEACRAAEQRAMLADFPGAPWLDTRPPAPVPPLDACLPRLDVPVLVVNGEHELADFVEAADALMAALPDARREVIGSGGGFPLWEVPERANAVVERFLSER